MKKWSEIWNPSDLVIIHLNFRTEGVCFSASLENQKSSNETFQEFDSIEEIIKKFGKSKAYAIHVNGTGVLTRLVEFLPGYKEQLIVNGDKDDFYFTSFNDDHQVATSFFRKSLIEDIVTELKVAKVFLVGISCGIIPVLNLALDTEKIAFDYTIQIENQRITKFSRNEQPADRSVIQGIFKEKQQAINEGILSSLLAPNENYSSGFTSEENTAALENYSQFNRFRFFGIAVVFIVLSALIINHFYLNHLNNQVADLETELTLNNDNLTLLENLKQEKIRKELLVQSSGVNQDQYLSFFIDRIGETVPKSISLQAMNLFPLKEALKEKRKVEIQPDGIEIIGTTPSSEILDDWMEKMERFQWVESVELLNYLKSENGKAEFKLLISMGK
jgi:Tfp pilus assembly protein PilN